MASSSSSRSLTLLQVCNKTDEKLCFEKKAKIKGTEAETPNMDLSSLTITDSSPSQST